MVKPFCKLTVYCDIWSAQGNDKARAHRLNTHRIPPSHRQHRTIAHMSTLMAVQETVIGAAAGLSSPELWFAEVL